MFCFNYTHLQTNKRTEMLGLKLNCFSKWSLSGLYHSWSIAFMIAFLQCIVTIWYPWAQNTWVELANSNSTTTVDTSWNGTIPGFMEDLEVDALYSSQGYGCQLLHSISKWIILLLYWYELLYFNFLQQWLCRIDLDIFNHLAHICLWSCILNCYPNVCHCPLWNTTVWF